MSGTGNFERSGCHSRFGHGIPAMGRCSARSATGTRDHLIHGYDLIDHHILWDAVHIDIPRLIEAIDELLA